MSKKYVDPKDAECVKVAIRCRPLNTTEKANGNETVVRVTNRGEIFVKRPFSEETPKQFTFDLAYDEKATQLGIFEDTAKVIV